MGTNHKKITPPLERVMRRVACPDGPEGCWLFTGCLNKGYGYFTVSKTIRQKLTHVFVYEALGGIIYPGNELHHQCENKACCNPAHLDSMPKAAHTMIGNNPPAKNARKTHCPKGHLYSPENTYVYKTGRVCRTCAIKWAGDRKRRLHPRRPPRTHCESGLHRWTPENWIILHGIPVKRCRLCHNIRQNATRKSRAA